MLQISEKPGNIHAHHRERMRSKVINYGASVFHDHEVLELLLFYAVPRKDTNPLAHELLARFGTLEKLFQASVPELMQVPGVGESAAVLIKTVLDLHLRLNSRPKDSQIFQTYKDIGEYFVKQFTCCDCEKLLLLLFDKRGRIDRSVCITHGTGELAAVSIKTIMQNAVSSSAVSAAIAHNHPGGSLTPSYEDKCITIEIDDLLQSLGICLIDHYVVADGKYMGVKHSKKQMVGGPANDVFAERNL